MFQILDDSTIVKLAAPIEEFKYIEVERNNQNGTATHELGHTIGLADFYNSYNSNKIMYGISDRTVYSPISNDITGAKEAVQ